MALSRRKRAASQSKDWSAFQRGRDGYHSRLSDVAESIQRVDKSRACRNSQSEVYAYFDSYVALRQSEHRSSQSHR
ncbi:DUF1871 family protein [Candidatus Obscuribacterales bacterium]|nr:DUF1871 family protein [Candidatus Obscuribacterales bacterium]